MTLEADVLFVEGFAALDAPRRHGHRLKDLHIDQHRHQVKAFAVDENSHIDAAAARQIARLARLGIQTNLVMRGQRGRLDAERWASVTTKSDARPGKRSSSASWAASTKSSSVSEAAGLISTTGAPSTRNRLGSMPAT